MVKVWEWTWKHTRTQTHTIRSQSHIRAHLNAYPSFTRERIEALCWFSVRGIYSFTYRVRSSPAVASGNRMVTLMDLDLSVVGLLLGAKSIGLVVVGWILGMGIGREYDPRCHAFIDFDWGKHFVTPESCRYLEGWMVEVDCALHVRNDIGWEGYLMLQFSSYHVCIDLFERRCLSGWLHK